MKRFSFRFGQLQKIREREEEAGLLRLALAQTDLAREQKTLAALATELDDAGTKLLGLVQQGAASTFLCNADAFRSSVGAAAGRQKGVVDRALRNVADKQEEFRKAHQKAEAIRKLHEKRSGEHRVQYLRETQKDLDEIGGRKHVVDC